MAILESLQRLMKGTSRANVESAIDIKELGVVEDAEQPEAIYQKKDASGYFHLPMAEWLASYVDNKGGGRLIGLENDSLSVLSGDTHLQAAWKALDTYLNTLVTTGTLTLDTSNLFDDTSVSFKYYKHGNRIFIVLDEVLSTNVKAGVTGVTSVNCAPSAAFDSAGLRPQNDDVAVTFHMEIDGAMVAITVVIPASSGSFAVWIASPQTWETPDSVASAKQMAGYELN